MIEKKRVLILCTANSARSQMAEGYSGTMLASDSRWKAQARRRLPYGPKPSL